jgi:hypothetical protein
MDTFLEDDSCAEMHELEEDSCAEMHERSGNVFATEFRRLSFQSFPKC